MKIKTETTIENNFELADYDLYQTIKEMCKSTIRDFNEHDVTSINISFDVPRGGDYSGSRLEICDDFPLKVKVQRVIQEG